jgi:hypothetical protein
VQRGADKTFASELRAATIARTELRMAQNTGTINSYTDAGVKLVQMVDGDDDEPCRIRNAMPPIPVAEARQHAMAEHPNGTLDFIPIAASIEL